MTAPSARPRKAFYAFLVGITLVGAGLVGEIAVRVYAAVDDQFRRDLRSFDPLGSLIVPHGELGYRQRPNSTFRYWNGTFATSNAEGYRGPAVEMPKPANVFRIVLLGGSTTHGWGVSDDETVDAHLRDLLTNWQPERRSEVINLAFDGFDSYQVFERLRTDGLPRDPDLIIVNLGINDVRNARIPNLRDLDSRTMLWAATLQRLREDEDRGGPSLYSRLKHYSYMVRLPGLVRQRLRRQQRLGEFTTMHSPPNLEAANYFVRNLERVVGLAASRSVPVIFSVAPSSIPFLFEPEATSSRDYWINDAATTQRVRDTLAARMEHFVTQQPGRPARVFYVSHDLRDKALFLDDCHLTGEGNRRLAINLLNVAAPLIVPAARSATFPKRGSQEADRLPKHAPADKLFQAAMRQ